MAAGQMVRSEAFWKYFEGQQLQERAGWLWGVRGGTSNVAAVVFGDKKGEELTPAAACVNLESTLLSERGQAQDHMLQGSIYLSCSGQVKPQKQKVDSCHQGLGGGEQSGCSVGAVLPFGAMNVLKSGRGGGCMTLGRH